MDERGKTIERLQAMKRCYCALFSFSSSSSSLVCFYRLTLIFTHSVCFVHRFLSLRTFFAFQSYLLQRNEDKSMAIVCFKLFSVKRWKIAYTIFFSVKNMHVFVGISIVAMTPLHLTIKQSQELAIFAPHKFLSVYIEWNVSTKRHHKIFQFLSIYGNRKYCTQLNTTRDIC